MSSFGGSIKLTGESEYRQALKQITTDLKATSNALRSQAADFANSNKSLSGAADNEKDLTRAINENKTAITNAQRSYSQYTVALQAQQARHNALNREYKNAVLELDRIAKSSGTTSDEYKKQAQEVDRLAGELVESTDEMDKSKRAMSDLKREINNATKTMNDAEKGVEDLGNETEDAGEKAEKAKEGFTVFKGVVANLASEAITRAMDGLKKLGGALVDVGKQAIDSYAQYEQLTGGVETLFKESAPVVREYAENAYKTAGLSANEYMETVTSFSASLLQGLNGDTAKAAGIADLAIRDMSDNANKMGTSMEMIQNAYQGFAKDNFTMLDNLKLGYGGTQAEAARLVNETGVMGEAFKATAENVKDVPFDKFIEAIHKVQEQMGITGTTSMEASETIEGSANSMKASWQNLLTAIADDNADLGKSIDIFISSVITSAKNLVPRIKTVITNIKNMAKTIVTDVFPKLKKEIPQLKPLIETFEWFIKNRNAVVAAIKAMVAAFVVAKVASWTKSMSDAARGVIEFVKQAAISTAVTTANTAAEVTNTTTKVAGTAATGALTTAQNLLNAAMAANPVGMVIAGLTALVGVIGFVIGKTNEASEAEKARQEAMEEAREEIDRNVQAWEDLKEAQQKQIDVGMTETAHLQSLWDELQGIVDQNGKVKEGYEQRADFITSTLSEALGIEIETTDGVIGKYDELQDAIVDVIEQKKAQLILDAQESGYKTAIEEQTGAVQKLMELEQQRNHQRASIDEMESLISQHQIALLNAKTSEEEIYHQTSIQNLSERLRAKQNELDQTETMYNEQSDLVGQYAFEIGQYETNLALFHDKKYEEMSSVNWEFVKDFQDTGEAQRLQLEAQMQVQQYHLDDLKRRKEKSGSDILNQQIKDAETQLEQLRGDLSKYNKTTDTSLKENTVVWHDNLAANLTEITGADVKFENAGDGNVQMYIDGVKSGEPKSKREMSTLISNTIQEIRNKKPEADRAGQDVIDGCNNGISNQSKQSSVFSAIRSFGSSLLANLRASLQEKSPSRATKEMGEFLLVGLQNGVAAKAKATLNQVSGLGANIINALNTELSQGAKMGAIDVSTATPKLNGTLRYASQQASYEARQSDSGMFSKMVEAFKTALKDLKIELDDEVAGKFVERTVSRVIYS